MTIMRAILILCALTGLAGCAATPAHVHADAAPDSLAPARSQCMGGIRAASSQVAHAIDSCTAVIDASETSGTEWRGALTMRARLYAMRGKFADAVEDDTTLLHLGTQNYTVLKTRADAYRHLGSCTQAVADYDRAIKYYSRSASAFYGRGEAEACLKNHRLALADYARAIALSPHGSRLYARRANAQARALADAAANAQGDGPANMQGDSGTVLPFDAQPARTYLADGTAFSRLEPADTTQDGGTATTPAPASAESSFQRGTSELRSRHYRDAVSAFDETLALNPRHSRALESRGLAYMRLGDYDKAMADFTAALSIDPGSQTALNHRADLAGQEGHYIAAIADYTAALNNAPNSVALLTRRASAYVSRGQYDLALRDFQRALALDPKNQRAANGSRLALQEQSKQASAKLISIEANVMPARKPGV